MATYKKRGHKPKNKKEEKEAEEMQSTTAEVFGTLDESASRTEAWVASNQKYIFGGIGVVVVAVLGFLGYQEFIKKPKNIEASNESFFAQQYFNEAVNSANRDSLYTLALNGAEGKYGFLDIIEKYKGTDAANLANYSAGMAYLNMNKYEEAIAYLQNFSTKDAMLGPLAKGGIADAFMQLNQPGEALGYYEEAFAAGKNDFTTPKFLFKAGIAALELEQKDKALKYFNRIRDEYPSSDEGRTVEIYIGKVESSR